MTTAIGHADEPEGHESYETEALGKRLQGTIIAGTYRLSHCIGAGGSSLVFEAEHLRLARKFAIKVLRAELDGKRAAQRFRREAAAIARLHSEHVVSVVDCGELEDRTPYLVMELLAGEDLRRLLSHAAPLPARRAVHLAIETCRGLSEVHRAGLVHRDLKPENLFVTRRSNGRDWCKILDFGVAKMEASVGTAHGAIVGTVRYMAPEQLVDSSTIGPAADVHAVGAILFECLTGRPLVRGGSVQETMFHIINTPPRELMGDTQLPAPLTQVILACLDKSPERRPASTAELAQLLANAVGTPVSATEATLVEDDGASAAPQPAARAAQTTAWTVSLGALTMTLVGAFLGWQVSPGRTGHETSAPHSPLATSSVRTLAPTTTQPTGAPPVSAVASAVTRTTSDPAPSAAPPRALAARTVKKRHPPAPADPPSFVEPGGRVAAPLERFDRTNPYGD